MSDKYKKVNSEMLFIKLKTNLGNNKHKFINGNKSFKENKLIFNKSYDEVLEIVRELHIRFQGTDYDKPTKENR